MRERLPQRARRALRIAGLGDRPHDDDPRRAALERPRARCPRRARRSRTTACRRCSRRARRSAARRRAGRAWSASRARARPRSSRRPDRRPRPRPGRARAWSGRRSGPGRPPRAPPPASRRPARRARRRRRTPRTRSGRSLRMNSASWPRNASDASTSPSSSSVLSRSCTRSTPPRTAAAIQSRGRAGHTRYRRAVREALAGRHALRGYHEGLNTGARNRAERAPPGRRPSNLIRVVPA